MAWVTFPPTEETTLYIYIWLTYSSELVALFKQALIQELSEKAKKSLSKNRLTTPMDDSALLYFNKILKIAPDSVLARTGIRGIADRYAILADQAYRQFDYEKAGIFTRKGLEMAPNHARLKELKTDLTRSKPGVFLKSLEKKFYNLFSD